VFQIFFSSLPPIFSFNNPKGKPADENNRRHQNQEPPYFQN